MERDEKSNIIGRLILYAFGLVIGLFVKRKIVEYFKSKNIEFTPQTLAAIMILIFLFCLCVWILIIILAVKI